MRRDAQKYIDHIRFNNPSQSHWEINQLLIELEQITPAVRRVLEIGVHRGGSARVWRDVFDPMYVIGVNGSDELDKNMDNSRIRLIEGFSQREETLQKVRAQLGIERVDFLFIDGGHLYDEVSTDFNLYSPLVRPGGIIAFHDVLIQGNDTCEVYKFWPEVCKGRRTKTIWDGTPTGTGTGVVYL